MKFSVVYEKPKKSGTSKQKAVFYKIEDAILWEKHVKSQGCENVEVVPIL